MISNLEKTSQQRKQRQLNTCHHNSINKMSSLTLDSLENTKSKMSSLTATVAAATANKNQLINSPMETVVVNSIIYSKPSFCRISVDIDDVTSNKKVPSKTNFTDCLPKNGIKCFRETTCSSSMDLKNSDINFDAASCFADSSSLDVDEDAKLYRMCTTINGSIHHQISDLCDNILTMAGIFGAADNEHDDDSFIEFSAYASDSDDDDEDDLVENEYDYDDEVDDDNDVVDFSYDCLIESVPKINCDRKKKVRFNAKPTVHVMHTWKYAYQAARKGEWEMFARDRERFKLRIQRTGLTLNPILDREHRQKIYDKRFANLYNKEDIQKDVSGQISNETSTNMKSKKPHQKNKHRKRRFCKMGNKHYF